MVQKDCFLPRVFEDDTIRVGHKGIDIIGFGTTMMYLIRCQYNRARRQAQEADNALR